MGSDHTVLDQSDRELEAAYRGEVYRVRDNGAVCRQRRLGSRKRPLDDLWTFGVPNSSTGYMHIGTEVVHRIVATAFHGEQPSGKHIVDHIDTNRRNNRVENLRWVTRLDNILNNPVTCRRIEIAYGSICQSALKWDPLSASKRDPFDRRVLLVALASSELVGVA